MMKKGLSMINMLWKDHEHGQKLDLTPDTYDGLDRILFDDEVSQETEGNIARLCESFLRYSAKKDAQKAGIIGHILSEYVDHGIVPEDYIVCQMEIKRREFFAE